MAEFVTLHGASSTAIWELPETGNAGTGDGGSLAPLWRYWGPRLPDGVTPGAALRATRPEPSFSLHCDQPLSLFPGVGMGWFGQSALLAHRAGGDWSLAITQCALVRPDAASVAFHLVDGVARVAVVVRASLDPADDVLILSATLTNQGDAPLDVSWLAAGTLPLPPDAQAVLSYAGRHNAEFVPVRDQLGRAIWRRENRRGITSHDCFPGALVTCADGTAYGAQLAWSGNHAQHIAWCDDGRWHWQMGEWLAPGEVRLAPGESLATPELLAACSAEGIDGVAQAFHRVVRARAPWPGKAMRPRPVHLNSWEACYFSQTEAEMIALASAAAAIGVERFVLDDGWFHRRDDDTRALGDWWPDAGKYPQGLGPLAAHVTGLGMEFGLWVEPEMVSADSDLYRAHPDWALTVPGRPTLEARRQLVLDLSRRDVRDHLYGRLAALLGDLPIRYLKWDHNRDLTHAGATAGYRRQVLGTYALLDRLRAAFPALEIEGCAGGGGRIDAGMAARVHRFWASDNLDPASRVSIQRGFLHFLPPGMMGSHVGASPAHATGRPAAMAFRCGVALAGHFGVELDPRQLDPARRGELAEGIARYKALRHRLHTGALWQGEAGDAVVWQAHGGREALVLIVTRTAPTSWRHAPLLRLSMLDASRRYRLTRAGAAPAEHDGAWLRQVGLPLPPMAGQEVLVYEINAL